MRLLVPVGLLAMIASAWAYESHHSPGLASAEVNATDSAAEPAVSNLPIAANPPAAAQPEAKPARVLNATEKKLVGKWRMTGVTDGELGPDYELTREYRPDGTMKQWSRSRACDNHVWEAEFFTVDNRLYTRTYHMGYGKYQIEFVRIHTLKPNEFIIVGPDVKDELQHYFERDLTENNSY